ncbi:MAG: 4-(cytidine 5'-diphospho)-2-C-methyl-D-erythritol kinase [Rhodospirillales bacterium]|nr:MAG: 4-(cytidine 5'-diphospho)-2-C-methyl-D-erythritol kinase [Rhodospirillales bacterium]
MSGAGDDRTVRAFAPAKVNLYLHVTGRRDDGYHLLDSLVVFAELGDVIVAQPADALSLSIDGPFAAGVPDGPDNLVLRAAAALAAATGIAAGARIHLTKNLPPASGIGGGSADAAATLRALRQLWGVTADPPDLDRLALALGADVPVCLYGRPAFFAGIGEELMPPPPLPPAWLVLVNPGVAVATAAVFRHRDGPFSPPGRFSAAPPDAAALAALLADRRNDLEPVAMVLAPPIVAVRARLEAAPGALLVRMSGSGATVFALFAGPVEARAAAAKIQAERPGWWVRAAAIASAPEIAS